MFFCARGAAEGPNITTERCCVPSGGLCRPIGRTACARAHFSNFATVPRPHGTDVLFLALAGADEGVGFLRQRLPSVLAAGDSDPLFHRAAMPGVEVLGAAAGSDDLVDARPGQL